jgi:7-carboxy-7-deazaguanine synthase
MKTLVINEIFHSIQGESTLAGRPCVFVRLTGCDLRCSWCDTEYAFYEGRKRPIEELVEEIATYDCNLVEVTGGEPLLQPNVHELIARLLERGKTVMIETGGHRDATTLDPRVRRILDVKTPSSGECGETYEPNFETLRQGDEIKFVISDRQDFEWALRWIETHARATEVPLLFSPVHGKLDPADLAQWMLESGTPARLQLQLHKILWPGVLRGV